MRQSKGGRRPRKALRPRKGGGASGGRAPRSGRRKGSRRGTGRLAQLLHRAGLPATLVALGLGLLLVLGGVAGLLFARCGVSGCPDPGTLATYVPGGAPALLDRHGVEFASLHPLRWEVVPLEELPPHLADAFVAVEDRRFRAHRGVDWIRAGGVLIRSLTSEGRAQGASTLTMQLARSVFPDQIPRAERTLRRKVVEIRVARSIERTFPKDRVLELYLNHVYLGAGAHGVQAAARHHFGRSAQELDLADAALLAAMARAPASYDPRRYPERAEARRNLVLSLMEAQGRILPEEADQARSEPLGVPAEPPPPAAPTLAPYFVDAVRQALEEVLGADAYAAGLRVHTTLDPTAQEAAEESLADRLNAIEAGAHGAYAGARFDPLTPGGQGGTDYLQGAVIMMEAETGDILALVGGRDFAHSRFNRATSGRRQVGSAFKPFVMAAALEAGIPMSQPIQDRPFRLVSAGSPDWSPRNYDGTYQGAVGMKRVIARSLNVPTARLGMAVGIPSVARTARRVGIESPLPETPALVLGTASLSPLELTTAYATLARMGTRITPRFLLRVEDAEGRVLYPDESAGSGPRTRPQQGLDPRVAFLVTHMLEEVVRSGTGTGARGAGLRGPVAGKTGTSQDASDIWFVGYTPEVIATVWIGHDQPRPFLPGATGGGLAAPVWGQLMARTQEGRSPPQAWSRPDGIVEAMVDPGTGAAVSESCPTRPRDREVQLFLAEFVPAEECRAVEVAPERGVLSRLAGSVRGLFGGRSQPDRPATPGEGEEAPAPTEEVLEARASGGSGAVGTFLGVPPVRLRER